jgi:hypothetical protein
MRTVFETQEDLLDTGARQSLRCLTALQMNDSPPMHDGFYGSILKVWIDENEQWATAVCKRIYKSNVRENIHKQAV